ncbi:hypothetical protein BpHYR1_033859 [Brachionus plicatilis]|uniref:Uncharacterized protein n=1 Tax=Brachionus plicatilis TaxID=10195 RepID=A0A3M7SAS4_BRAPC|nr:hypothetical protein BpHYR1_033859 [Brachionus plicatilis]
MFEWWLWIHGVVGLFIYRICCCSGVYHYPYFSIVDDYVSHGVTCPTVNYHVERVPLRCLQKARVFIVLLLC